ncbi:MAG: T9SS type A sorting domain-containing protein [Bacteroidales bacterium]|nr:T9SS type A sorting domain-containing protein [Bacteroidales bacterium]MCF8458901.1 T9SS type A sorting domain-containing protein [Bacteroidales bacterium]
MKTFKTLFIILIISGLNLTSTGQVVNGSFEDEFGNFSVEGWQNNGGIGSIETPPNGGSFSLGLFGGCMWVNCQQDIPIIQEGEIWELRCWVKADNIWSGGSIGWSDGYSMSFVFDTNWVQISVIDTFTLSGSDTISIVLEGGGGIAGGGGILVDLVEIEKLGDIITALDEIHPSHNTIHLSQNSPNPFHTYTTISVETQIHADISLKVYDVLGQEVYLLAKGFHEKGKYDYIWRPSDDLRPGVYFYRLKVADSNDQSIIFVETKNMNKVGR